MPTFATSQLLFILPEIALLSGTSLILIFSLFLNEKNQQISYYLTQLLLIVVAIFSFNLIGETALIFDNSFIIDDLAVISKIFIILLSMILFEFAREYLINKNIFKSEYLALMLLANLGMMIMISGYNFITLYLGLEIMSLSLYALIAMANNKILAIEAALKYFILGAIASAILLYGISLIYGVTGSFDIGIISEFINQQGNTLIINFATVFLIIGIAFKLGAAPFHNWVPDVYQGSTLATTMFLSSLPKIAAVIMLVRIITDGLSNFVDYWSDILMFLGILSIAVGTLLALVQTNLKRLLAYSTIAHIGFILVAFAFGTPTGYSVAIFYTFVYVFTSIIAFGILIILSNKDFEIDKISDLTGIGKTHPIFGLMMLLTMFSMAGVPPLIGFYAKLLVLREIITGGQLYIAIVIIVFAVIGAYYYLKIIKTMYFDNSTKVIIIGTNPLTQLILIISASGLLILGIFPDYFIQLAYSLF